MCFVMTFDFDLFLYESVCYLFSFISSCAIFMLK